MSFSIHAEDTATKLPSLIPRVLRTAVSHTRNTGTWSNVLPKRLVAAGVRPGDMVGIFLPNCWEFGVAFHAATLAGATPTTMNPTYRDREVHYQMETSGAVALISDGPLLQGIDLSGLPALRKVYTIRNAGNRGNRTAVESIFVQWQRNTTCAGTRFPIDDCDTSLLQRNYRVAQGSDAVASQHRCQRVPDSDVGRGRMHRGERCRPLLSAHVSHLRADGRTQPGVDAWVHGGVYAAIRLRGVVANRGRRKCDRKSLRTSGFAGLLQRRRPGQVSHASTACAGQSAALRRSRPTLRGVSRNPLAFPSARAMA